MDGEPVTQRARQQASPRRGAHQGEAREIDTDRLCARALSKHDVDSKVFQGRVEHLFHRAIQAMNLVNEQHLSRPQRVEDCREIASTLDDRTAGRANLHPEFFRDDVGQRGLAQARRTREQDMVHRLPALLGGADVHAEVLDGATLTDVLVQVPRSQRRISPFSGDGVDDARKAVIKWFEFAHEFPLISWSHGAGKNPQGRLQSCSDGSIVHRWDLVRVERAIDLRLAIVESSERER